MNERRSIARRGGVTVPPSPLNPVKRELGVILVTGVFMLVGVGALGLDPVTEILVLLGYGVAGTVWVALRTHRVLRARPRGEGRRGP